MGIYLLGLKVNGTMTIRDLFLLHLFFAFPAFSVSAFQKFPHSKARLLSNFSAVSQTTESLKVGIEILLDEGWHTYWKNPGDSGAKPTLDLSVRGATAAISEMVWPTPERLDYPPLTSFAYTKRVLLWKTLTLSKIHEDTLLLEGNVEWLVCKVECIPAFGKLTLSLPVSQETPANTVLFEEWTERLPNSEILQGTFSENQAATTLSLPSKGLFLDFFPDEGQGLDNARGLYDEDKNTLTISREGSATSKTLRGLGLFRDQDRVRSYWMEFKESSPSFALFAVFAFLGGLILNLMPCVLPILSLKVFSFLNTDKKTKGQIRLECLSYSMGVLCCFLMVALVLSALRAQGQALGWGFQLQEPAFVGVMVLLFMGLSLNFLGLFEFQIPGINAGASLTRKGSLWGSFFTGLLSVLVASPCTAPFMGAAMGFALSQPLAINLAIFSALSLGFSFPFLLLALNPNLARSLPKPGAWMQTFKTFLFFPLLLTVLWLLWVFSLQLGLSAMSLMALACVALSFGVWWQSHLSSPAFRLLVWLFSIAMALGLYRQALSSDAQAAKPQVQNSSALEWEEFSQERLAEALRRQEPVFVDFTAAWCLSCQVNEKIVFGNADVLATIRARKIRMLKADWTNRAPHITRELEKYGRYSVPLYLYFAPGKSSPVILPELLTPKIFLEELAKQ